MADAKDPQKLRVLSVHEENAIQCESLKKGVAIGMVDRVNDAEVELQQQIRKAISGSKIKTGPFGLW